MQTRFFGTALGFIVAILWPVSHIFILILINGALGRPSPYGDSAPLFFATGLLPFMCFNYMSRFTCLGVMLNKPLLGFPIVKVADLLLARGILEVLNAAVVVMVTIVILAAMGVEVWPPRPLEAMYAMLACMTLGFGYGVVNGVIAGIFPFWFTPFSLSQIVLWMASGVIMVPDELPESGALLVVVQPDPGRRRVDAFGVLRGLWPQRTPRQTLPHRLRGGCDPRRPGDGARDARHHHERIALEP